MVEQSYQAREDMDRLAIISKERIQEELLKGLSGDNPAAYIENLHQTTLLYKTFPEFIGAATLYHDARGYHDEESVLTHTKRALDRSLKLKPELRLAVLLHDNGKMGTLTIEDGKRMFKKHDELGAVQMNKRLEELKFSTATRKYVVKLIRHHMEVHELAALEKKSPKRVRRNVAKLFVALGEDISFIYDLFALAEADSGQVGETAGLKALVDEFNKTPRAVTGDDIPDIRKQLRGKLLANLRVIQLTQKKGHDEMLAGHLISELKNLIQAEGVK